MALREKLGNNAAAVVLEGERGEAERGAMFLLRSEMASFQQPTSELWGEVAD